MLPFYEWLAIALMVLFILALFTGFPVAWLLAGGGGNGNGAAWTPSS